MKNKVIDFLKGALLGLDVTIPGFSVGTLAVLLKIYERLIEDLSNLTKHPFKVIKKDLFLGIGFIVGFVLNIFCITFLLENFPLQTVMFFVGLVILTIPSTFKKAKQNGTKITEILCFIISLAALIGLTFLNAGKTKEASLSPLFLIMMVIMGIISCGFMIVPGISGSLIVLACGYYDSIIGLLGNFLHMFTSLNFSGFIDTFIPLILFLIGAIAGAILFSKIILLFLKKRETAVYSAILGLLVGSPFAIIYLTINTYKVNWSSPWLYIVSSITLIAGIAFGFLMNKLDYKQNNK